MNTAILLTGGNMGDRTANILKVKQLLEAKGLIVIKQSNIYETAAWGKTNQSSFLNQVLIISTLLKPIALLNTLLQVEKTMGRQRLEKYGPRIMDIDILFYNNDVVSTPDLEIPHPQIGNRRFVLQPLHEVAANYIHPVTNKPVSQLLAECKDLLEVTIFKG